MPNEHGYNQHKKNVMRNDLQDESQQRTQGNLPQMITLNNTDRDHFLEVLASEEGPNEALIQATHKFNKQYGKWSERFQGG